MDGNLIAKLSEAVSTSGNRAARAQAASDLILRATSARWVGIYTVASGLVSNEAWAGPGAPAHPTFPETDGLTSHAIRARSVALSNDVSRDPRYLTNQDDSGSELIVPVLDAGRVVGTLDIESSSVGAFDGAEIMRYEELGHALLPLWRTTGIE